MSSQPILTNFVSEVDQFLQEFDRQHPMPTKSQQQEISKYKRIYKLRDTVTSTSEENSLWEDF